NAVTEMYQIDGIPEYYSNFITIRSRYDGALSNETFMATGVKKFIYEEDAEIIQYKLNEVRDSAGYLIANVPAWTSTDPVSGNRKSDNYQNNIAFITQGITNYKEHLSDFFRIYYPSNLESSYASKLNQYLQAALDSVSQLGMVEKESLRVYCNENKTIPVIISSQDLVNKWNIIMPSTKPLPDNLQLSDDPQIFERIKPIVFAFSSFGIQKIADPEMENIAQRCMYRTLYYLFGGDSLDWFGMSSLNYFSDRFSSFSYFDPENYKNVFNSLLKGMESGIKYFDSDDVLFPNCGGAISAQHLNHSYSMYPFIKYLDNKYGGEQKIIRQIINNRELSQFKKSTEGTIETIDDPATTWWPDFIKELISGNIMYFPPDDIFSAISSLDEFNFDNEEERIFEDTDEYFDLSAKLYRINFTMPDLKNELILNISSDFPFYNSEYFTHYVFGYKDDKLEFLTGSPNLSFDLNSLFDAGYRSLVVAVINSTDDPPFDRKVDIEFEASLKRKAQGFTHAWLDLEIQTQYNFNSGPELMWLYYNIPLGVKGEFEDYTFTAEWDGDPPDPNSVASRSVGNITIKFNPDQYPFVITDYYIDETLTYLSGTRQYILTGENVHIEGSEGDWGIHSYTVSLDEACKNISSVYMIYTDFNNEENSYSTNGAPVCDEGGYLNFQLNVLEEK
ncbi:MAG: hypothetical protein ACP5E3_16580, partial [Bacteroidales bacterium]